MEDFIFVILVIIWLAVSFLKQKPKSAKTEKRPQPASGQEQASPSGDQKSWDTMFDGFFGETEETKEAEQPVFEDRDKDVEERAKQEREREKPAMEKPDIERDEALAKRVQDERETQRRRFETDIETQTRELGRPELEKSKRTVEEEATSGSGVSEAYKFASDGKIQTIDDMIRQQKQQEAKDRVLLEDDVVPGAKRRFPHFKLRDAVVFSEILHKKYR